MPTCRAESPFRDRLRQNSGTSLASQILDLENRRAGWIEHATRRLHLRNGVLNLFKTCAPGGNELRGRVTVKSD